MSPGARWIAGVISILVGGVLAMVFFIVMAQRANAGRVVPDYYQRAVRYDDDIAAADASRALGWSATAELTTSSLRICLRDRAAAPVTATVAAVVTHRAHPDRPQPAELTLGTDGCGTAPLTLMLGVHDVALDAHAGAARFVAQAVREVQ